MEIENSARLGEDRRRGARHAWSRRSTPTPARAPGPTCRRRPSCPTPAEQDVITNAIIYKPGRSRRGSASPRAGHRERRRSGLRQRPRADRAGLQAGRRAATRSCSSSTTSSPRARPGRSRATPTPVTARARPTTRRVAAGARRCATGCRRSSARRAPRRSCSPATSTPTPRRTRCRSSTTRATPTSSRTSTTASTPTRSRGLVRLARPRPGQRRRAAAGRPEPTSGTSTPGSRWRCEYSRYNYHVHAVLRRPTRTGPPTTTRWSSGLDTDAAARHGRPAARHQRLPRPDRAPTRQRSRPAPPCWPGGQAAAAAIPEHRVRRGRRPDRRVDLRVVHPEGQADHRRAERRRPRGLGGRQPRVRPGLRRPGRPGDGAIRRRRPTRSAAPLGVPRRQRPQAADSSPALPETWVAGLRRRAGRLRRRGHRPPARAGLAGRHRRV